MENNFSCPVCNNSFFIPKYINKQDRYYIGNKELLCVPCLERGQRSLLVLIEKPFEGFPSLGRFTLLSREDRKKHLKKRSRSTAISQEQKLDMFKKSMK